MKTLDISGFGGPYENACQTMLQRFLKWADKITFEDLFPVGDDGKRHFDDSFRNQLLTVVDDIGPSGAMFNATLSHFAYIMKYGWNSWINSGVKKNRIIDWNSADPIHFNSPEEAFEAGRNVGKK